MKVEREINLIKVQTLAVPENLIETTLDNSFLKVARFLLSTITIIKNKKNNFISIKFEKSLEHPIYTE